MRHIAILDIGKTNKKCFVFDEAYLLVSEKTAQLPETVDEDGFPCENLEWLRQWVWDSVREILEDTRFQIRAIHCTTYGASFVHLDAEGRPLTPLYNYLKPFPESLQQQFLAQYGGAEKIALETASPVLGCLNSGLQLYWLKYHKPLVFNKIKWSLHLPQYVVSNVGEVLNLADVNANADVYNTEMTSIGCHTMLWHFQQNDYHPWVKAEGLAEKFPPICPATAVRRCAMPSGDILVGVGLHDSSAALIPYLASFKEPFVLISTGTWCISLNPFNDEPLTAEALAQDCLCYLSYEGKPVKAARFFGGHEHDLKVKELAAAFGVAADFYKTVDHDTDLAVGAAYLGFMRQFVDKQVVSTRLAIGNTAVRRIFVDGGFSNNAVYMYKLARAFPEMEVFAAEVAQATALGAALAIHDAWNRNPLPNNLIALKKQELP